MKCSKCKQDMGFIEWLTNEHIHKTCLKKVRTNEARLESERRNKESISEIKKGKVICWKCKKELTKEEIDNCKPRNLLKGVTCNKCTIKFWTSVDNELEESEKNIEAVKGEDCFVCKKKLSDNNIIAIGGHRYCKKCAKEKEKQIQEERDKRTELI
jgi:uncharacterized CHY-type Zn-finger protein